MVTTGWRARGFTLIELLVVIAIIAVLAAILWPVMSSVQEKGRQTKCTAHLCQLNTALGTYKADYGRYPFAPWYDGSLYQGGFSALYPDYVSSTANLLCPDDSNSRKANRPVNYSSYNGRVLTDWNFETVTDPEEDNTGTQHRAVTYNFYGLTNSGWEDSYWNGSSWQPTFPPTGAPPTWLTSQGLKSRHWPRLMNPRAPDNTITTHCVYHRKFYGDNSSPTKWRDIWVRRGGEAGTCNVSQWYHKEYAGPPSASEFKIQK